MGECKQNYASVVILSFFSVQKGVKLRAWGCKVTCFRAKKQHHGQLLFSTLHDYSLSLRRNTAVRCAHANIPTASQNAFHL